MHFEIVNDLHCFFLGEGAVVVPMFGVVEVPSQVIAVALAGVRSWIFQFHLQFVFIQGVGTLVSFVRHGLSSLSALLGC